MKKICYLFVLLALASCDKEEGSNDLNKEQEEFYDLVEGYYELREATTDTPIDLNHDGVPHTDIYKEVSYCSSSLLLNSFSCGFRHKSTYSSIVFDVPTSEYVGPGAGINSCLRQTDLSYDFKVNAQTQEVMLVQSDYWDDFAAGFHAEVLDVDYENHRAYFTLRKRFRVSSGETKWVMLYLKYVKIMAQY